MRIRRITAGLITLTMLLFAFTAFAQGDVELTLWDNQTSEDTVKIIKGSMERFAKDTPGFKVNDISIANDNYQEKFRVALASNSVPDLFLHWSGGPMVSYIKAGAIADITEYMDKDNYKDRFMDGALSQATYDGKLWAVPIESLSIALFFYNKDVFDANGIAVPTTLSELEAACEKLKAAGITPFALSNKSMWPGSMYYMYLVDRYGGSQVFSDAANMTGTHTFEDPAFVKAGNKIQEWVSKDYFNVGFNGLDEDDGISRQLLYNGDAAMYLMGTWALSTIKNENPEFYDKSCGIFAFPAIEGGAGDPNGCVGTIGCNFYSVSSKCAYPEQAFKALTYLLDDTAINERVAMNIIPPLKGIESRLTDEKSIQMMRIANKASSVQLWYDQYMAPVMAELHKTTCQELFAGTKTPEQVDAEMQAGIESYWASQK
jgi:raffinose/stachyose/melibiose transport system substrate-binding protein